MRPVCQGWGWRTGAEAEVCSAPVLESLSLHRTSPMVPWSPRGSPELQLPPAASPGSVDVFSFRSSCCSWGHGG